MKHKGRGLWMAVSVVLVLALLLGVSGCTSEEPEPTAAPTGAPTAAPTQPDTVWELTFSTHNMSTGTSWPAKMDAMDWIEEQSNGRIQFTNRYHSGQLASPFETLDMVKAGVVDVATVYSVFYPAEMDLRTGLELPLLADEAARGRLATTEMLGDPRLVKEAHDQGIHYLASGLGGYVQIYHSPSINTLEDFAGKSVTAYGGFADVARMLGANPIMVPEAELYESLQKGLLDVGMGFWTSIGLFKLWEVIDYTSNIGLGFHSFGNTQIVNLDTWNSLPPDLQEIMEEGFKSVIWRLSENQEALDRGFAEQAEAEGMQLSTFSQADIARVKALSSGVIDAWVNNKPEDAEARRQLVQDWIDVYDRTVAPEGWEYNSMEFFPEPE